MLHIPFPLSGRVSVSIVWCLVSIVSAPSSCSFFFSVGFEIDEEPANPLFFRVSASTLPRKREDKPGVIFHFCAYKRFSNCIHVPPLRLALFAVHERLSFVIVATVRLHYEDRVILHAATSADKPSCNTSYV